MKKVTVLGNTGMLGRYTYQYLSQNLDKSKYEVTGLNRSHFDASSVSESTLNLYLGDIVINCIGTIRQRGSVSDIDFIRVNSLFPHILSKVCNEQGSKLIHISTDCVFSGKKGHYIEYDTPDPMDMYGRSKFLGELIDASVIRTSIIGEELKNKLSFLEWVKSNKGKEVNGFIDHQWNGVTTLQLSKFIFEIITKGITWNRMLHYHSPQVYSKYKLIQLISDKFLDGNITVKPVRIEDVDRSLKSMHKIGNCKVPLEKQLDELKLFKLYEG